MPSEASFLETEGDSTVTVVSDEAMIRSSLRQASARLSKAIEIQRSALKRLQRPLGSEGILPDVIDAQRLGRP